MKGCDRDGDGFLLNKSDWSEEVMYEMAKMDGIEITDEIKSILIKQEKCIVQQAQYHQLEYLQKNLVWIERQVNCMKFLNLDQ